uniref:Uncharacterized protein n=1 Tax=Romanomermis culicivorax TaxID=13658 RepID=A0A915K670_ROMCU
MGPPQKSSVASHWATAPRFSNPMMNNQRDEFKNTRQGVELNNAEKQDQFLEYNKGNLGVNKAFNHALLV